MTRVTFFIFLCIWSGSGLSQEWQWRWGSQTSNHAYNTSFYGLATDRFNNITGWTQYDTSLWISDTLIHHPVSTGGFAFPLYNSAGKLIKLIDLWSDTGHVWNYPVIAFDDIGNTYLSCTASGRFFINSDTVEPIQSNKPMTPQLFLAKFASNGLLDWIQFIHGNGQVFLDGMVTGPDNMLYLEAKSYTTFGPPGWVVFFDQDSVNFTGYHTSLLRINTEGTIRWRKPVSSGYYFESRGLFNGDDGMIYFQGSSSRNVIFGTDTIRNLVPKHSIDPPFLLGIDTSGILKSGRFFNMKVNSYEMHVDNGGAIYFGGRVVDTLFWGSSQVVIRGDTTCTIFGKVASSGLPLWYNLAKTRKTPGFGEIALDFQLALAADSLTFAAACSRHFRLNDSVYYVGEAPEVITGICNPDGVIIKTFVSRNTYGMQCTDMIRDHCGNLILSGAFRDSVYFGPDSLKSWSFAFHDGYISNLGRYTLPVIDLGADRSSCSSAELNGPAGFAFYRWNNGLSDSRDLIVTETGKYWLSAAGSDLCWATDTIIITIDEKPVVDLWADTTIFKNDHLVFSLQPGYDHYEWSTGDTVRQMVFYGFKLGFGDHLIWASAQDGTCTTIDSVNVRVVPGIGVAEHLDLVVRIYPNPSPGFFTIESSDKILNVNAMNIKSCSWNTLSGMEQNDFRRMFSRIGLQPGLYCVRVTTVSGSYIQKLVIL